MKFSRFSKKQLLALTWWHPESNTRDNQAIICDGAVRSGKTVCLSLSFLFWSFAHFRGENFAICGKTIRSLRRNLVIPLEETARQLGFSTRLLVSQNLMEVTWQGVTNRFYLFGGKDEGSASLIQGITLGGILFDEVALMPRSFVEQGLARCSVEGAKFWFNCNPEHPSHWFYKEWIEKKDSRNVCYIHFTMEDNPSLSQKVIQRYKNTYSGVFYSRYVEGRWVAAHGAVYPMFLKKKHVVSRLPSDLERFCVSCDYGTTNPASFGLWGFCPSDRVWYRIREYYHCSRTTGVVKTDEDYYRDLTLLVDGLRVEKIIVDPSAASFIQTIRSHGRWSVVPADNRVTHGIRLVSNQLGAEGIRFHESCVDSIREFSLYRWNLGSGADVPLQRDDHAMDDIRYFVSHVFGGSKDGFYAVATSRK